MGNHELGESLELADSLYFTLIRYCAVAYPHVDDSKGQMMAQPRLEKTLACSLLLFLLHVASPSVAADELRDRVERGRGFLAGLYDRTQGLLPEYPGATVYWLYHDNYLAAKVLEPTHPQLAAKISATIARYGERKSGKIEILFGEVDTPLPFRQFQLVDVRRVDGKTIRTERVTQRIMTGWEAYADLRFFAALALAESDAQQAQEQLEQGLAMWDGNGFRDRVVKQHGIYATYKLALAVLAADKLREREAIPRGLVQRLSAMQNDAGGWITDYDGQGKRLGKANVETSSLAILALESVAGRESK